VREILELRLCLSSQIRQLPQGGSRRGRGCENRHVEVGVGMAAAAGAAAENQDTLDPRGAQGRKCPLDEGRQQVSFAGSEVGGSRCRIGRA